VTPQSPKFDRRTAYVAEIFFRISALILINASSTCGSTLTIFDLLVLNVNDVFNDACVELQFGVSRIATFCALGQSCGLNSATAWSTDYWSSVTSTGGIQLKIFNAA
jgi:hypothetical protein